MICVLHQVWNCSFEQLNGDFGPRQNEGLLTSPAVGRWERQWLYCPFQLNCDFSGMFLGFLLVVLLIGFDSELQELLQTLHRNQEKAALKAADPSSLFRSVPAWPSCLPAPNLPAWWVAGVLLMWSRTHLPTRPLLKAEVFRKPVPFFFFFSVGV